MPTRALTGRITALATALLATPAFLTGATAAAHPDQRAAGPRHIFVIMMENHGVSQVIGNTADAPYITGLARRYNVATNYHGVTHPSMPNYLAAISGDFQGIWDDCPAGATVTCPPEEFVPGSDDGTAGLSLTPDQIATASATPHLFTARNIVDQLEAKGLSWKAYLQSMPSVGFPGAYGPVIGGTTAKLYTQKHNPFMYFSDINSPDNPRLRRLVPFEGTFDADLASGRVPDFVWISPDQCHDMHGLPADGAALVGIPSCARPATGLDHSVIALGDAYVRDTVTKIMSSRTWRTTRSSIVLVWDENDFSGSSGGPGSPVGAGGAVLGGGDAPLIVINSAAGRRTTAGQPADHYTLLATIQHMWHLGCLANTCSYRTSGSLAQLFGN